MNTFFKRQVALVLGIVFLSFFLLSTAFTMLSYRYVIEDKKQTLT